MKKRFLNLQLFADEVTTETTATDQTATETQETETKASETTATKPENDKKYTDEDVNNIIKRKKAEWEKTKQKELDEEKEKAEEAKRYAEMNAQEKAEHSLKKEREAHAATQKELDEYKRKDALSEMSKEARKTLSASGISVSDELLSRLVTTDAEETKNSIDSFIEIYKADVEKGVKERLRGETPKTGTGSAAPISEIDKRIKKYE